jgi:hypothetical protein
VVISSHTRVMNSSVTSLTTLQICWQNLTLPPQLPGNLFSVAFLFFPATPPPSLSRHLQPSRYPRSAAIRVDVTRGCHLHHCRY